VKLQRREKILAAILGGIVALVVVWLLLFTGDSRSTAQLEDMRDKLTDELSKKEARVKLATKASGRLAQWQRRALPSDAAHARTLYLSWLRQLAVDSQFQKSTINPGGNPTLRRNAPTIFTFILSGQTSLPKLVEFFHKFHSAGHLQQIRRVDVKPVENSTDLDVTITIEAMSLLDADRKDQLTKEPGKSLRLAKLEEYSKMLVERNLFSAFQPAGAPASPPDMAQTTFVTGLVAVDGRGEVWLLDKTSNKDWSLHEGEPIKIGTIEGTVKSIGPDAVTIEVGGKPRTLRKGDPLRSQDEASSAMKMPPGMPRGMPPGALPPGMTPEKLQEMIKAMQQRKGKDGQRMPRIEGMPAGMPAGMPVMMAPAAIAPQPAASPQPYAPPPAAEAK
jgi:hypothetical protein